MRYFLTTFLFCVTLLIIKTPLLAIEPKNSILNESSRYPIDFTINPCENFHAYVCSKAEESVNLRSIGHDKYYFAMSDLLMKKEEKINKFLFTAHEESKLNDREKMILNYFYSCRDEKSRSINEKQWLQEAVAEALAINSPEQLASYVVNSMLRGRLSFLATGNIQSLRKPDQFDLEVGVRLFNLSNFNLYEDEHLITKYKTLLKKIFQRFHKGIASSKISKRVEQAVSLERQFLKILREGNFYPSEDMDRKTISLEEFKTLYPKTKIDLVFDKLHSETRVFIESPSTLSFYNSLLTDEHFESLKDLLFFNLVIAQLSKTNKDITKELDKLANSLEPNDRTVEESCYQDTTEVFDIEFDFLFTDQLANNVAITEAEEIAQSIKDTIIDFLSHHQWLSKTGKEGLVQKIKLAKLIVGKPKSEEDWPMFKPANLSKSNYIENREHIAANALALKFESFRQKVNVNRWNSSPMSVTASYDHVTNKFYLPMGYFQYPFLDKDLNRIERLGAIGFIIGHELSHGLDPKWNSIRSSESSEKWFTEADLTEFEKKFSLLVAPFDVSYSGRGKRTLHENAADLSGLTFAYHAAFPNDQGSREDKKKFFVSYGRIWCTVMSKKRAEFENSGSDHALWWERLNETLKHLNGFQDTFSCKAGNKMFLPEEKRINIW